MLCIKRMRRSNKRKRRGIKRVLHTVLLSALAWCSSVQASAPSPEAIQDMANQVLDSYLLPGYERASEQAKLQRSSIEQLCAAPSETKLKRSRQRFADLVRATERMILVRFGPMVDEHRLDRLLFWPDRRGIALRQIRSTLANKNPELLKADVLREHSVALQGMSALEYSLFGDGAQEALLSDGSYRCDFAYAVSEQIASLLSANLQAWQMGDDQSAGFATYWRHPGKDNPYYRDEEELLSEIVSLFANGFAELRDQRIITFWDDEPSHRNPKRALYYRSEQTIPALQANIRGFSHLLTVSAIDQLLAPDDRWIIRSIQLEFDNINRVVSELEQPTSENLRAPKVRDQWVYTLLVTRNLQRLFGEQLASRLGFAVSFSPLDGD